LQSIGLARCAFKPHEHQTAAVEVA
jgi:hypothetical protein